MEAFTVISHVPEQALLLAQRTLETRLVTYPQATVWTAEMPRVQRRRLATGSAAWADASARLRELAALPEDWDGAGARRMSGVALGEAQAVLEHCFRHYPRLDKSLRPFGLAPLDHGGIHVEWRRGAEALELDIEPTGETSYLLVDRSGVRPRFSEGKLASRQAAADLVERYALAPYGVAGG